MSNDLDDLGLLPTLGNLQMFTSGQIFSGTYVETLGGLPQIDHKLNDWVDFEGRSAGKPKGWHGFNTQEEPGACLTMLTLW